jgi:hypothetical protein
MTINDPLRVRDENLWEEIDGMCICQQRDVSHWCETCQRRIERIYAAFHAVLAEKRGAKDEDWNARGAADIAALDDVAHTNIDACAEAIRQLDRRLI